MLIVSYEQYGVHVDTAMYCRHLSHLYDFTYICPNRGYARIEPSGATVRYQDRWLLGKVELALLRATIATLLHNRHDLVFLMNTKLSFLIRLLFARLPMILDVRTGSVARDERERRREERWIRLNARFFSRVTVVSEGLGRRLGLNPRRFRVMPVGADRIDVQRSSREGRFRLLYVGTFTNRSLETTIAGFAAFARRHPELECRYTLVGSGSPNDLDAITKEIGRQGADELVSMPGRIPFDSLGEYFASHDVGIAYTPALECYEEQPSTKIWEYLQAGMPCMASDTAANRRIVDTSSGVLVGEGPEEVTRGLENVAARLGNYDPEVLRSRAADRTWERIAHEIVAPIFDEALRGERCR